MRARIVLASYGVDYILREVDLKNKPAELVECSPKSTVPVLLMNGAVIDESFDVLLKVAGQGFNSVLQEFVVSLSETFIKNLNYYKYPSRYDDFKDVEHYKSLLKIKLDELSELLVKVEFDKTDIAQIAIYPFVRQLRNVDEGWFFSIVSQNLLLWMSFWDDFLLQKDVMAKHPVWSSDNVGVVIRFN